MPDGPQNQDIIVVEERGRFTVCQLSDGHLIELERIDAEENAKTRAKVFAEQHGSDVWRQLTPGIFHLLQD